ncbi:acyl-CoA thioesterase YciA [Legionella busanensis]|uniref:Acyl-CoA thioesterase YciA n=1 Tax=Legionella busanensis TaxID=190655 RepID=A0A378JRL9_9GAMM|nr:acyl-CoA thioester hydrolase YciA [Legionella busanensis]STX52819.1 acyl-CoA thioesterase YciA [Legionella busanensis]
MIQVPRGEVTIQTLAMPADTNANGDIFGGWLVSQMDLAAGVLAKKLSQGRAATVAINSMTFLKPVRVGDIVSCYAELVKLGKSSMTIDVEVWAEPATGFGKFRVTEGTFVFVAIDEHGKPREVPKHT